MGPRSFPRTHTLLSYAPVSEPFSLKCAPPGREDSPTAQRNGVLASVVTDLLVTGFPLCVRRHAGESRVIEWARGEGEAKFRSVPFCSIRYLKQGPIPGELSSEGIQGGGDPGPASGERREIPTLRRGILTGRRTGES